MTLGLDVGLAGSLANPPGAAISHSDDHVPEGDSPGKPGAYTQSPESTEKSSHHSGSRSPTKNPYSAFASPPWLVWLTV